MAKRKKSKQHPKSKPVAQQGTAPEEITPEAVADAAESDQESLAEGSEAFPIAEGPSGEDGPKTTEPAWEAAWADSDAAVPAGEPSHPTPEPSEATSAEEAAADAAAPAAQTHAGSGEEAAPSQTELPLDDSASPEATDGVVAEVSEANDVAEGEGRELLEGERLESIIESLLFASDKALGLFDLKRLLGERDGKKISAAVESLIERRKGTGIEVIALSTGWHLRTSAENATWVSKLLVGRPVRLSRAMLETLAIVAYRQPVTRPEVDDIRGVDCGAVLKTLLDRGLIRIIGKKEEVGRPMLYGTTPEFLRVFNLRDLSELPTLREFYDLSAEDQSRVEAEHGSEPQPPSATTAKPDVALTSVARGALSPEPEENDPLLDELDEASQLAKKALGDLEPPAAEGEEAAAQAQGKGPPSPATE